MKYLVVIEETDTGFSAYSPDVPGCVAAGDTREETEREIASALTFHLEGVREDGSDPPEPTSFSTYVEIPA